MNNKVTARILALFFFVAMAVLLYAGGDLIDASYDLPHTQQVGVAILGFLAYGIGCGCGFVSLLLWTRADRH